MDIVKIILFDIYQYAIPLSQPLSIKGHSLKQREGLIIHIATDSNDEGIGEIAPLAGFSHESLTDVTNQVLDLKSKLLNQAIPENCEKLNGTFSQWLDRFDLKPSVQFGIEAAILNLIANSQEIPLCKLLFSEPQQQIGINGLLQGSQEEVVHHASNLINQGYKAFKLKVGGKECIENDIAKVRALSQAIDGRALLHLDANKSWNLNEAVKFGKGITCALVDYIEEPLKDITCISQFFEETLIPAALDESLSEQDIDRVKSIEGVDIFVLKPTILGGIEKTWQIKEQAKLTAIETIISSTFESSIGIHTLANLAASSPRKTTAGLDTLKWFKNDLLKEKLPIQNGRMAINQRGLHKNDINFDYLTRL